MDLKVNDNGRVLYLKESQLKCDVCDSKEILFFHEYLKKKICNSDKCFREINKLIPRTEAETTFMRIDKIIIEE